MVSLLKIVAVLSAALLEPASARTAGCGKAPPSSGTRSIGNRQYTLQVPADYDPSREYRLVFGFHWLGGNMNNVAPYYYGLRPLAGESTIFVAPDGLDAGWANGGGSDVTFVDQILAEIHDSLCVDESQTFAAGFSYGGSMSYALACSRPSAFHPIPYTLTT